MALSMRPIAIVALACLLLGSGAAAAATRIVLLPISVHATGAEVEYLQSGLMEMLASRLDQYEGLVVVRPGGEVASARDGDAARAAGRDQNGDYVLFGSFTRFGDGASLDLRCAAVGAPEDDEARDLTRRVFIQAGTLSEIIPQLDTVAQKVARYTVSGGAEPTLVSDAHPATSPAPSYQDLLRRVEALERALAAEAAAPGVASAPGEAQAEPDSDS